MKNSEKISLNLKNSSGNKLSEQELALRSKAVFHVWTYVDVVNFIETNFEEESIKKELIKVAKKYPHSAYPIFIKNIQKTVNIIIKNRSEEINKNFVNKNLKSVEKNIQDIKKDISIEEEIKLEMNKEIEANKESQSEEELKKEFE